MILQLVPVEKTIKHMPLAQVPFGANKGSMPVRSYAVVDTFEKKIVDVDGDSVCDLSHGDFIACLVEARNGKTYSFKIDNEEGTEGDLKRITAQFKEIARQLRKKEIQLDAVNFSYYVNVPFNKMSRFVDIQVTPKNVHKRSVRNELVESLKYCAFTDLIETHHIIKAIEEVTAQGVPVYICAGNHGAGMFNLITLAKGTVAVGNVDNAGIKRDGTANNSLVRRWAKGVFNVSAVKEPDGKVIGFDVTGTGKPEVPVSKVSGGESKYVRDFYSTPLGSLLADKDDYSRLETHAKTLTSPEFSLILPDYEYISEIFDPTKLYEIDKAAEALQKPPVEVSALKKYGEYTNYTFSKAYKTNQETGTITNIDYDRTGRGTVNVISGTSYAAPLAMVEDGKPARVSFLSMLKSLL